MRNKLIELAEQKQIRNDLPELKVGYNVRVHVRIKEGDKERIQVFEGLIIALSGEGTAKNFTVRKNSYGIGVERVFKYNSPLISHVEITRKNKVRRAKLFYMRDLKGKAARLKEIKNTK
ncbi:50S ribosomal protein L19 [Mycoplasma zalophi]|uniref:Large ribosomal subunit protein bL19 n=1 Tax=Mycoplasma zalophi TaxID=191287 RepID=A0ABS6DQ20_9MOLU|nr:50S ribosomal protein L19 [Mycoplasma zalophi]MBU4690765.1 50S ribosomal protein L19 [Mycoplasma zalophi]MBU4692419.1 50S ribosomal protein L19 [Mycoplasma zalophi]MCU4117109.1 50S ribosomal protein L19 [Mycoplasma zalophi]